MSTSAPSSVEPAGNGIFAIDTGFHRARYDAAWLIVDAGRAAFIDTGTAHSVPRLMAALRWTGLRPDQVDWIIPTHVHLDHAGGVGTLLQHLPRASVLCHPRGVRHLVDPLALWRSATAIYGQARMDAEYGGLEPVPAERIRATDDGEAVHLGERTLMFAHTPGHALHHHCIWDEATAGWFTGDTFGMALPEFRVDGRSFIIPATTPIQFEPEAMHASIDRLLRARPRAMYLTHYARLDDPAASGPRLHALVDATVACALAMRADTDRSAALARALLRTYVEAALAHGVALPRERVEALLVDDAALNAAGLEVWLDSAAPDGPPPTRPSRES